MGSPQHTRRHRSRGSCTHHHTVSTSYCCFLTMSLFHRFAAPVTKTVHAARVQVGWDGVHQCASPCRCTTPAAQRVPVHTCTSRLHCCTWVWPLRACAGAARFQVPMHTQPCMSFNHHDAHNVTVCKACTARALEARAARQDSRIYPHVRVMLGPELFLPKNRHNSTQQTWRALLCRCVMQHAGHDQVSNSTLAEQVRLLSARCWCAVTPHCPL